MAQKRVSGVLQEIIAHRAPATNLRWEGGEAVEYQQSRYYQARDAAKRREVLPALS